MMHSTAANPIKVLIADDHPLFREALRKLLESDPQLRVVGEARDGRAAVRLARELHPDIVLLDLCMPEGPGRDALRELSALTPPVRTLVLTAGMGDADVVEALRLGARGFLLKQSATDLLFRSIRGVMAGEYWVRRECVADLIERMRAETSPRVGAPLKHPVGDSPSHNMFGLTPRELEIVATVAAGHTNDEIARRLRISAKTVKHHLTNIFGKLRVSNRLELALFAVEHGVEPAM